MRCASVAVSALGSGLSLRRFLAPQREIFNVLTNRPSSLLVPETLPGAARVIRPEHFEVANVPAGHRALVQRLRRWPVEQVLLEATGGYERAVMAALQPHWPVVRVPPHRARAFATARGRRAKTDPIDAATSVVNFRRPSFWFRSTSPSSPGS